MRCRSDNAGIAVIGDHDLQLILDFVIIEAGNAGAAGNRVEMISGCVVDRRRSGNGGIAVIGGHDASEDESCWPVIKANGAGNCRRRQTETLPIGIWK